MFENRLSWGVTTPSEEVVGTATFSCWWFGLARRQWIAPVTPACRVGVCARRWVSFKYFLDPAHPIAHVGVRTVGL